MVAVTASLFGCAASNPSVDGDPKPPESNSRASAILACMSERGFDGELAADDTMTFPPIIQADSGAFDDAMSSCSAEYPLTFSETQILEMYALELEHKTCLESIGYQISEPPSEETYLTTFNTADWWTAITSVPPAERNQAVAKCPLPVVRP